MCVFISVTLTHVDSTGFNRFVGVLGVKGFFSNSNANNKRLIDLLKRYRLYLLNASSDFKFSLLFALVLSCMIFLYSRGSSGELLVV